MSHEYRKDFKTQWCTESWTRFTNGLVLDNLYKKSAKTHIYRNLKKPTLIRPLSIKDVIHMAKNFTPIEFLNTRLTSDHKKAFELWSDKHDEDFETLLEQYTIAGYKFGVSHDFDNDTFICSMTGKKNAVQNVNKCITARSNEFIEAVLLVLYKHIVLADNGNWEQIAVENSDWG